MRILLALLCCMMMDLSAQVYTGPIAKPISGYGAPGDYNVDSLLFVNPADPFDTSYLYYPAGITSPVPTVYFMGGNGGVSHVYYAPYFHFIASKGFSLVFVPSPTTQSTVQRYDNMQAGFIYASRTFTNYIDTTRVGFAGHSFGGGACFGISYELFDDYNWGSNGRFLMPTAQWYSYEITQAELQNFPANTYLLSFLFEDDVVCDHRMAIDIFTAISIPEADKDMVYVVSSDVQSYHYAGDHVLPNTSARYDAMDYYVLYRLTDAMMDFVFNGNQSARYVALGDGDPLQVTMPGGMNPLTVSDSLTANFPEWQYGYPCSSAQNPRASYCGVITSMTFADSDPLRVFPNPAQNFIYISGAVNEEYTITDVSGRVVLTGRINLDGEMIDLSSLSPSAYILECHGERVKIIRE